MSAFSSGTRVGPYELIAPLGAGGMGEVYRARDSRLGRDVAIKSLPAAFAGDPERLARFRREAQTLAALNHPNVAAIYGLDDSGGTPYLVLELVEGETLAARLGRGPLPPRDALSLGVQVAAAIAAAHERGVVHRDLKPGNVMLSASGIAKVLDFGLAKSDAPLAVEGSLEETPTVTVAAGATVAGAIVGTIAYMSPEQARGYPVDRRSDVWSFGCVLYEALTGSAAFRGDTPSDLIAKILEREPDWSAIPAAVPPRVKEILRRCLRKDAEARPRDLRDVKLELEEVLAGDRRGEPSREKSIAVMPFENQSGPDDEYFADGVTDEILNALAQVEGLRVAARSSCFAFKGRREDPRTIGEKLEVTTVLEGTVRRSGPRLRITAQLVNAADGHLMWSERYDRELTDVFAVQDEIAGAIAVKLRGAMAAGAETTKAKVGTKSVEAYEMFLKGRALQYQRGGSVLAAIGWFEKSIALDPNYAEPQAWLADSWRLLGTYGTSPAHEVMPKSQAAAERALALDPNSCEALSTLADIEIQYHRHAEKARVLWNRALDVNPRFVRARCERALWLVGPGEITLDEALVEMERAAADEPLNPWVAGMRSYALGFAGKLDEALAESERALELSPDSFFARYCVVQSLAWLGRYDEAIARTPSLLAISGRHPWALGTLCWVLAHKGDTEKAAAVFAELEARARHEFISPFWLAAAAAAVGEKAKAEAFAERAIQDRDPVLTLAWVMPQYREVWNLPRVRALYESLRS